MSKKNRWIGSALLLIVAIGLVFSVWKWGEPLLSPLVSNKNSREFIQWAFSILVSLVAIIRPIFGFIKFLTGPQKERKKIIDEKILDYNKILWPTSPEQLLKDYVDQNAREITWIDRGALTKEQLLTHTRILLVGRMKSGKSREIAEFIQKRLEEGTLLSSHLYDITEGMRTFDPELITDVLKRQLDRGQPTLFYVNDLPRQVMDDKQLEVLGEYLKALECCSPGYFLATARSDHFQASPRLQTWIRENRFQVVELPLLTEEQTGCLVDELANKKGARVDPEVRKILCKRLDGTPYHAILTFVYLGRTGEQVITSEAAKQIVTKSAQEIWLDIQKQVKEAEPLAAELFEALAVYYRANVIARPDMIKAYARSLARDHGQWNLLWGFNRHWKKALKMLEKYAIYTESHLIKFPDAAAEVAAKISLEEAMTRLENFALGYRRWLRNSWLSRFNSQAGAQQGLLQDLASNHYFRKQYDKALTLIQQAIQVNLPSALLWYNLGVLLKEQGDLEGAEQAWRAAVAADEKFAPAWTNLGLLLKDQEELEGAEHAWRTAVAADEKYAPAWNNLGLLLKGQGDLEGAEQAYRTAVAVDEKFAPAWTNLGLLLKDKGDLEGAERAWRTAVAADEKLAPAWTNLGLLLDNQGDLEGAEQALRAAVAADEKYAPAWFNLGSLLKDRGNLEGAEQAYRNAVTVDEKFTPAWYVLGVLLNEKGDLDGTEQAWRAAVAADEKFTPAWFNLGLLLDNQGDLEGAEQAWRAAVAADEKFSPAWYNLGSLLDDQGDLEGAERAYRTAVAADEKFAPAWYDLGVLLKGRGDLEAAEQAWRAAVAADEKFAPAWYNLGVLLYDQGDLVGAEQAWRAAVAADKKYAPAWTNLGVLLYDQGDLAGAERAWRAAVAADEKYATAWTYLGVLLEGQGDLKGAEQAFRAVVAADEKIAPAWTNLGVLFRRASRFADALPVCQQLVILEPERGYFHAQLGAVYQKLGRPVEAQTEFTEARRLMPGETVYSQACIAALSKEVEEALDLLRQALASGEVDRQWVRQDPDWEDFHADERWSKLMEL